MSRASIHYWKCDRASAFQDRPRRSREAIEALLLTAIRTRLDDRSARLEPFSSQGNHLAWLARHAAGERLSFVRVEDGPERDDYIEVESHLLEAVRSECAPTPGAVAWDTTRQVVPFAWQIIDYVDRPSLQDWHKRGELDLDAIAWQIGRAIADIQRIAVAGFGPFRTDALRAAGSLRGYHASYADYFFLNLDAHLDILTGGGLLTGEERERIGTLCDAHRALLDLERPCLVHKDTALWNLLGSRDRVVAIIDWDDAIAGDPVDDFALLGCFFPPPVLARALAGYETLRPRPEQFEPRLWLHVLRNLVFKAVIRLRAGYFGQGDGLFLIDTGTTGEQFRQETRTRLLDAMDRLEHAETSPVVAAAR